MSIEFPITVTTFLTIAGVATFSAIVGQWLKSYLKDWRWTNLVVLGVALLAALVAQVIASKGQPTAEAIFEAALIGLFGATLATFGYEALSNLLGLAGIGKRAMANQQLRARR